MSATPLAPIVAGAIGAGYLVIGIFFLRFWSRTRDALFISFAIAFALLALGHVLPALLSLPRENLSGVYLIRLAAFVLIIAAIVQKNISRRPS